MKCSVTSKARFSKSGKILFIGNCNVFADIKDLPEGCQVVIPIDLRSYKSKTTGDQLPASSNVGQPTYFDKKGDKKVSYLNVHLNGAAAKAMEALVPTKWLKAEVQRLRKTGLASDWQLNGMQWDKIGDRKLNEDDELLAAASADAAEFAAKAGEDAPSETVTTTEVAADQETADEVLGK